MFLQVFQTNKLLTCEIYPVLSELLASPLSRLSASFFDICFSLHMENYVSLEAVDYLDGRFSTVYVGGLGGYVS